MFPRLNVTAIVGEEAGKGTAQLLEKARREAVSWSDKTLGERKMRIFGAVLFGAAVALVAGPAAAQMQTPNINLLQDTPSKTPEEREQDAIKDKAYRDSLRKIPDAKASNDPWGAVRSTEAPKAAAPAKPKTKTGSTSN
jgi:hypothetical protein